MNTARMTDGARCKWLDWRQMCAADCQAATGGETFHDAAPP